MTARDKTHWIIGGSLGILLIHGLGGSPSECASLARALGDAGHTVCSVHLAGHGQGEAALAASTADDWRESVRAAHAVLSRRCDRVLVAGLSMGAILALDLAQFRPKRVHGVVLLAPALRLDGWAMPRAARFAGSLPSRLVPATAMVTERHPYGIKDERIRGFVLAGMQNSSSGSVFSTPLRALIAFQALSDSVRQRLSDVAQPTLIIHPREDDMASLSNAQEIAAGISGLADMVVLNDSYHLVTLDRQRRVVQTRVTDFVARIAATATDQQQQRRPTQWPPVRPHDEPRPHARFVRRAATTSTAMPARAERVEPSSTPTRT
jgi:carboxylesterase